MGFVPVAPGAFALLDDLLDRGQRGVEVGRPAISCGQRNSSGVAWARGEPTNSARSPSRADERPQPVGDAPVEVADGGELLAPGQGLAARRPGRVAERWGRTRRRPGAPCPPGARGTGSGRGPARRTAAGRAGTRPGSSPTAAGSWAARTPAPRRSPTSGSPPGRCAASPRSRCRCSFLRHRSTASACSAVKPSATPSLRLNSANRYWHMIMCSSCSASASSHHRCSRCATTTLGSDIPTVHTIPRAASGSPLRAWADRLPRSWPTST